MLYAQFGAVHAAVTAFIMADSEALPSTPIELVRRLTEQEVTPSTEETAFSTLALHAAQLIPVMVYFFKLSLLSLINLENSISQFLLFVKLDIIFG